MEIPWWSRLQLCLAESMFSTGSCNLWGTLKQSVPKALHPMERAHTGSVCEELLPMGRTHNGEVCGEMSSQMALHVGAGEEHEGERTSETTGYYLSTTPLPHPCVLLRKRRQRNCEWVWSWEEQRAGWMDHVICFNLHCFSYSTFNGGKENYPRGVLFF